MSDFSPKPTHQTSPAVGYWLLTVAFFVFLTLVIGGLTRLTDSGLSITEWQPISGIIPPLTTADWQAALEKYKAIPEYQLVNKGFSMAEFQFIYWWEWSHRLLGRLVGLIFLLPFAWFLARRQIPVCFHKPLWGLFALGGLQGLMGWYMVQSGLTEHIDVSQYRLAAHLGLALVIFAAAFWLGLRILYSTERHAVFGRKIIFVQGLVGLIFMQSILGALVAGLDAGKSYTDWPFMDGMFIPAGLLEHAPLWVNFFENHLTVQFDHRIGAYLLLGLAAWHFYRERIASHRCIAAWLLAIIAAQAGLGIATLILAAPPLLAIFHQIGAIGVLALALYHLHWLKFPHP